MLARPPTPGLLVRTPSRDARAALDAPHTSPPAANRRAHGLLPTVMPCVRSEDGRRPSHYRASSLASSL